MGTNRKAFAWLLSRVRQFDIETATYATVILGGLFALIAVFLTGM